MNKNVGLLFGCFGLLIAGIISISCKKDEPVKAWNGCLCTGGGWSETISSELAKSDYKSNSCKELGTTLTALEGEVISCKDL